MQRTNKRESGIYSGVPCESLFDREMQSPQFWSQIVNQTCPDFNTSSSIKLQKGNPLNKTQDEHDFFFVLDICEHFKNYTGRTDCKSKNESLAALEQIKVEAKISHEFFNVYTYLMNADRMNSEFITYSLSLNANAFQR